MFAPDIGTRNARYASSAAAALAAVRPVVLRGEGTA